MSRKKEFRKIIQQLFDTAVEAKTLVSHTTNLSYEERNRLFEMFEECRVQSERAGILIAQIGSRPLRKV